MSNISRSADQRVESAPGLPVLLHHLGFRPSETVSANTRARDGRFVSRLLKVRELDDWSIPRDRDVWFGVNPIAKSVTRGRGTEIDVTRVRVLFADLDIKEGSLETIDECREVVDRLSRLLGTPPAALVESGHGLQPYWRLASPPRRTTRIADDVVEGDPRWSRQEWREVYARWGGLVQQSVHQVRRSARIDNVYDLSRVLRCPGSVNHKSDPVEVVTRLYSSAKPVGRSRLLKVLDSRGARPLAPIAPLAAKVPTSVAEAVDWINAQPGAQATVEEMRELGPHRSMLSCLDRAALVQSFIAGVDDEASAHNLMRNRVQFVVLSSTENRAGLAVALEIIKSAYLEAMRLRREGRAPGEARSEPVARSDFYRAVVGAVARARGRGNSPEPQRDADGRIVIRTAKQNGLGV